MKRTSRAVFFIVTAILIYWAYSEAARHADDPVVGFPGSVMDTLTATRDTDSVRSPDNMQVARFDIWHNDPTALAASGNHAIVVSFKTTYTGTHADSFAGETSILIRAVGEKQRAYFPFYNACDKIYLDCVGSVGDWAWAAYFISDSRAGSDTLSFIEQTAEHE